MQSKKNCFVRPSEKIILYMLIIGCLRITEIFIGKIICSISRYASSISLALFWFFRCNSIFLSSSNVDRIINASSKSFWNSRKKGVLVPEEYGKSGDTCAWNWIPSILFSFDLSITLYPHFCNRPIDSLNIDSFVLIDWFLLSKCSACLPFFLFHYLLLTQYLFSR